MFERHVQVNTTPSPPRRPRHPSTAFPTSRGFTKSEVLGHMRHRIAVNGVRGLLPALSKKTIARPPRGISRLVEAGLLAAGRLTVLLSA